MLKSPDLSDSRRGTKIVRDLLTRHAFNHLLGDCGVTLFEDVCSRVAPGHVVLGRGGRLSCDAPVVAIGNAAPIWLRNSGLALDEQGFVATGPTLQCTLHPDVFAAGDAATRIDAPHAKLIFIG